MCPVHKRKEAPTSSWMETVPKIAKREKRSRETTLCLNARVLEIDLKGYRLIYKTKGKNLKIYGHCPTCAQFHEIDQYSKYGLGGYACEQCKQTSPENYILRRCNHCNVIITEHQYETSIRHPMVDIYDVNTPIKRVPYCKFHVPRKPTDYGGTLASNAYNATRFGNNTSSPQTTSSSLSPSELKKRKGNVLSYDTKVIPTTFMDIHVEKFLKRKSAPGTMGVGNYGFRSSAGRTRGSNSTTSHCNATSTAHGYGNMYAPTSRGTVGSSIEGNSNLWDASNKEMTSNAFREEKKREHLEKLDNSTFVY